MSKFEKSFPSGSTTARIRTCFAAKVTDVAGDGGKSHGGWAKIIRMLRKELENADPENR